MNLIERIAILIAAIGADMRAALPMLGEVRMLAVAQASAGWVPCDGRLLDVADYPAAGAAFGARWGGDGVTTFGVPDLRDRVPRGAYTTVLGSSDGADSVVLAKANLPAGAVGSVSGQTVTGNVTVNALNGDASPAGGVNTPTATANTLGKAGPNIFFPPGTTKVAVPTTHNLSVTGGNVSLGGSSDPIDIVPSHAAVDFYVFVGVPVP